ncbi:MAG: hypothetical protein FD156_1 [Nitrospirae bacterium]|nr:MAG: hypothetical protein FD156_1 [Nitrospirota bacterium]
MTKHNKALLIAVVCLLAIAYLTPVGDIIFAPTSRLPQVAQSQPSTIQVEELSSTSSAVLLSASAFTASQVSNEPFPTAITGTSPGSLPKIPLPRIRTAKSDDRDWYSTILTVVYFPIIMLAGGGPVLFGIIAIGIISASFKKLIHWRRIVGSLAWASLLIVMIGITYFLAIWPRVVREYYGQHQQLIWEHSPLTHYLEGGFSVNPNSPDRPTLTRLVVVNGTASPIDLYADGFWIDKVPVQGIRGYRQLRDFSRLTAVETDTQLTVDDFYFRDSGKQKGFLVYNVHGADNLSIEEPPRYR